VKSIWQKFGVVLFWVLWPALCLYVRGSERSRVLILSGDKVLLVKPWLGDGRWGLPGGGLHKGEEPLVGLSRELGEEVGLHDVQPVLLGVEQINDRGFRFTAHFFIAQLTVPQELRLQFLEIAAAQWVPRDSLGGLQCVPEVHRVLELSVNH